MATTCGAPGALGARPRAPAALNSNFRPAPRRARAAAVAPRADAAARVRGDARRVQRWVADVRHWTQWYPGTTSAVKLGSGLDPVRVGSKFETQREMLGLKLPMSYEVLEMDPGKRLVLSGLSEHHTQMDQFFFMADRHDPNFCCVRYIADVRLREWRGYLQPLATRFAARVPEDAMAGLQRALNCAASPVFSADFDAAYRQELRSGGSSRAGSAPGSRSGSRPGTTSGTPSGTQRVRVRSGDGGAGAGPKGGWLRDIFSSASRSGGSSPASSRDGGSAGSSSSSVDEGVVVLDPMGYYGALGLTPTSQLGDDEIRAAYRRLALQLHPDRQAGKDEAARAAAAARFAELLRAYDTLKDPEQRALYDAGQLVEATLTL